MEAFRVPVRAVLYQEYGRWVARCLEFDLCGDGSTPREAMKSMTTAMAIQIEHFIQENNADNLFCPADSKYFRMFAAGSNIAVGELQFQMVSDGIEIEGVDAREYRNHAGGNLAYSQMSKHRLKLRELRKILRSFDVKEDESAGKGSHTKFYKQFKDGNFSYPVPLGKDVLPCYVNGSRKKFRLTEDDGVTDDDFFGRA